MFETTMNLDQAMQNFIDGELYVFCETRKEIDDFLQLCDAYELEYSRRWDEECSADVSGALDLL